MRFLLPALALVAACSDSEPALSDAISLQCPTPGALPFRLSSTGFANSTDQQIATSNPRNKDEASDTIGVPGGLAASIYLPDEQAPTSAAISYRGAKARTGATDGLSSMTLDGEPVSLWFYDADRMMWQSIGKARTGDDGHYEVADSGFVAPNGKPVYAMLEADRSCATHYNYLFAANTNVVIVDIDGTLTTNDNELLKEVSDATYVPAMMGSADKLLQAWATKGYPIVYLTARPHLVRVETRGWLDDLGFPAGPLITARTLEEAGAYKTVWMKRMINDFHWNAVAVYGNADTDILAYANAGVAKDRTFIVGPLAGNSGTVAIQNNDYAQHIATFVAAQPANH